MSYDSRYPMGSKPLFIPLKREYFEAFAANKKTVEIRKYGPRWNERTCFQGRPVLLSLGYGKTQRLERYIRCTSVVPAIALTQEIQCDLRAIYGNLDFEAIVITLARE
jgi:hypothetical protein